jgi:hypothetical protein
MRDNSLPDESKKVSSENSGTIQTKKKSEHKKMRQSSLNYEHELLIHKDLDRKGEKEKSEPIAKIGFCEDDERDENERHLEIEKVINQYT